MIRTLVVDDDFRVADINSAYVERAGGFEVVGRAHTARAALESATALRPDLVLLDLYLPDSSGVAVLGRLRALQEPPDVIVVTAARDVATVRTVIRGGALHYLVKPFDEASLAEKLASYRRFRAELATITVASQEDVDRLYQRMATSDAPPTTPKGPLPDTVASVLHVLRAADRALSAVDVATELGISRPTAQRCLAWLHDRGQATRELSYGNAGRPAHRYRSS